jgi:PAS domain S-box-containing protein
MEKISRPSPNNFENVLPENEIIVSKTDTKGVITYVNEGFMHLAKYKEFELLGRPHNMIRHPDMPKVIFKLLWDYIKSGKEINAYVKNLSKDGSYYWVFANVTPSYDKNGRIIGYYSVRRKPKKETINSIIAPLYKKLIEAERVNGVEESAKIVNNLLKEKGLEYEEFILSI